MVFLEFLNQHAVYLKQVIAAVGLFGAIIITIIVLFKA